MLVPWTPFFLLFIVWLFRDNIRDFNMGTIILLLLIIYFSFTVLEIVINAAAADTQNAADGKVHRAPAARPRLW
jgi:hypothetical protein